MKDYNARMGNGRRRNPVKFIFLTALVACAAGAADSLNSQAEFGGQCPEALAEGQHVTTDCSVTWTDKDGKLYCFSNEAAKKSFLQNPVEKLAARARVHGGRAASSPPRPPCRRSPGATPKRWSANRSAPQLRRTMAHFPLDDSLNGAHLKLAFDDIDFTRTIDGYGFFPDVKFHDQSDAQKNYLIDFWVVPVNGKLQVQETRIYKEPLLSDGKWTTMARQPVPWWWIPASEHPGHLATKRGWEVMSAVEQNAMQVSAQE